MGFFTQKGLALAGVGRLPEAAVNLWQAVEGIEILRQKVTGERTGFLRPAGSVGGYIRPYQGLVAVLSRMALTDVSLPKDLRAYGRKPEAAAFYFAEAAKARTLLESMAQAAQQTSRAELPADLRQREQSLLNQIAANEDQWQKALLGGEKAVQEAKNRREKLNLELQTLIGKLRKSHPLYAALHYPQPLPAQDLPLQGNEVLLEYALGEAASYVFVVRKGGVQKLFPDQFKPGSPGGKDPGIHGASAPGQDEQFFRLPGQRAL